MKYIRLFDSVNITNYISLNKDIEELATELLVELTDKGFSIKTSVDMRKFRKGRIRIGIVNDGYKTASKNNIRWEEVKDKIFQFMEYIPTNYIINGINIIGPSKYYSFVKDIIENIKNIEITNIAIYLDKYE